VVSIKVLSFVQQAGESRRRVLALGVAFGAGILLVFLILGALAAGFGAQWGDQFQSSTFLIIMIAVVFAFALSLFDVFEVGLPSAVSDLAGSGIKREGLVDAFMKGMLATVLATPCSGPFLGSTLAWALAQSTLTIYLVFTALGLGMAIPYVILTANPALLKIVPKPGPWMQTFKQIMGFVLLATVAYLMVSLESKELLFTNFFLGFVALGCWWWGHFARFDQTSFQRATVLVVAMALIAGGGWLSFGVMKPAFGGGGHGVWQPFDPIQMQAHHDQGRSVFVDFTADWCPNCKYNERFVYEAEDIQKIMQQKGVVMMKADITHKTPYTEMVKRLMNELGGVAIPFMAVFPGDQPSQPHVLFDIVTKSQLGKILERLPGS
jgi:thiol:disulfide interchange protein DsbD